MKGNGNKNYRVYINIINEDKKVESLYKLKATVRTSFCKIENVPEENIYIVSLFFIYPSSIVMITHKRKISKMSNNNIIILF